ncbi:PREDICTED: NADP-dependent malic enzyme, mitochondrial [Dipodomys ordii]|uniref:Malic enzyme n=1 Tax=Dipodomys ordii TaxID=10020 RepID=A0A1S3EZV1_DIPOR|nr:PREDICTED: NADP-dependent malic enzyme, mitochondrial [Dipodomys ordii]
MGTVLVTGTRLAPLPRRICSTLPHWAPSGPARGCQSKVHPLQPVHLKKRGFEVIRTPPINKGLAFTLEERLQLGIHGLLAPCFQSQDVQLLRIMKYYDKLRTDLDRYIILMTLQDRNEKLFYRVLSSDVERFMPIVYTPTVGLACQHYGVILRRPRGLFITIHDKDHIATILNSWPEENIKAVVVTDGERILGLGDLGSFGMGIPTGKLTLYTACGGVSPQHCLPVLLDVGTNNEELLRDPLYIGLKHRRVRGKEYDEFLDAFMQAVTDKFGISCLVQFEDFANDNAFRLLHKYRNKYCMFNDDIQGTASVAVAGILAALRITKKKLSDQVFVFLGAGGAAMGITHLLIMALQKEGVSKSEAVKKIWMMDADGLIIKGRGIFASGSPFDSVTLENGQTFTPGQGNNAYVFPGVALGVIAGKIRHIPDEIFLLTAEHIAQEVSEFHLSQGRLYPPFTIIRDVSIRIAAKVLDYAYKHNLASYYPEPTDKEAFLRSLVYTSNYDSFRGDTYTWPKEAMSFQTI